jgi:hypothetical protein
LDDSTISRGFGPILAMAAPDGGLYAVDGQPVWPLRDAREREALERMAAALGNRVELITRARPCRASGPEVVVGLGSRAFEDAELYAHLTLRTCIRARTRDELASLPIPAVVVTTFDHVDEELLDLLYDRHDRGPMDEAPGLIFGFSDDELRCQVLARAACLRCPPREHELRRADVYPLLAFGCEQWPDVLVLGAQASPEAYRSAFSAGAGVLTLSTHSDGIDAQLLPDLVLCPMDRVPDQWERSMAPSCLLTGSCHRRDRPMSQALEEGSLLSPSGIVADVLVHSVCWGLYPAPGVQSPAWSLVRRVLEGFDVAAVMTTWEIVSQTVLTTAPLFHELACGVPLGRALARHLSSADALQRGHKLCLLGDPAMRLSPRELVDPFEGAAEHIDEPELPSAEHVANLALLRMMVMQARRSQRPGRTDTSRAALAAAMAYEAALITGEPLEDGDDGRGPQLRRAMIEYLADRLTDTSKYWIPCSDDVQAEREKGTCPACGRRTVSRVYRSRIPGASARCHTHCPTCGPVGDLPLHRHVTIAVEPGGLVRLGGELPHAHWYAQVVLDTQVAALRQSWPWPVDSTGAPAHSFQIPEPWPRVPLRVAVLLLRGDCELDVVGCLCRLPSGTRRGSGLVVV